MLIEMSPGQASRLEAYTTTTDRLRRSNTGQYYILAEAYFCLGRSIQDV